jgi:hypothetical protein
VAAQAVNWPAKAPPSTSRGAGEFTTPPTREHTQVPPCREDDRARRQHETQKERIVIEILVEHFFTSEGRQRFPAWIHEIGSRVSRYPDFIDIRQMTRLDEPIAAYSGCPSRPASMPTSGSPVQTEKTCSH